MNHARIRRYVCRRLLSLVFAGIGLTPSLNSIATAQHLQAPALSSEAEVLPAGEAYSAEYDPSASFFDEVASVDPLGYWPDGLSASDPDDSTGRYQMLVLTFDLTGMDPQYIEDVFVFYTVEGEAMDAVADVVAYAPARASPQAGTQEPQRVHAWRRKSHITDSPLHVTRAVRQALELGADSLEVVVYTARPLRLSGAHSSPTMEFGDASTFDFLSDDPVGGDWGDPGDDPRDSCKYCYDNELTLRICGPTVHCCGENSTYTVRVWGTNDSSGDLEIDVWDDEVAADNICSFAWIPVGPTFDVTRTCTFDPCEYEPSYENQAEIVGSFELHEGGFNNNCGNWSDELLVAWPDTPSAPSSVSASDGTYCDYVRVTWGSVSGASYYKLYRDGGQIGGSISGTSYNDYVGNTSTHSYKVRACNSCDACSGYSSSNSGYRKAGVSAPSGVAASDGTYCDYVRVTWNSVSGASYYKLYRDGNRIGGNISGTSHNDYVGDTSSHSYKVKAYGACGDSGYSNSNSGYRKAGASNPSNLAATDGAHCSYIRVTWNSASGASYYKLYRDGSRVGGNISGTSYDDYVGDMVGHCYTVKANGACGDSGSSNSNCGYRRSAPSITGHPGSATTCSGQSHQFCVSASGIGLSYQWQKNSSNIGGATSSCYSATQAGSYRCVVSNSCGSATSNSASLTVNAAPSITSHPGGATICSGQSHQFCVSASGSGLSYQWQKNSSNIGGATSSCYSATQAGSYRCVVSNSCGSATSNNATLTVNPGPSITSHPSGATICSGQSHQFCVSASGSGLSYQWQKNSSNIGGATSSCYSAAQAGSYRCVVSNSCGSDTSNSATLTVTAEPPITQHPSSATICSGQSHQFCVTASGSGLSYQWQKNSSNIGGASSSCYSATQAGSYRCVVSNNCESATSNSATLTIAGSVDWYPDLDHDGYGDEDAVPVVDCDPPSSDYVTDHTDCDDNCSSCHPGGTEVCDGKDNDCDGETDENIPTWYRDADSDGYGDGNDPIEDCIQPVGYVPDRTDCDDSDNTTYPGAQEPCDGVDHNCDEEIAEIQPWCLDADDDDYGTPDDSVEECEQPLGHVADCTDCDDSDSDVNPGATDLCEEDRNCDGLVAPPQMWCRDADGDSYGNPYDSVEGCTQPPEYIADCTDCNDSDPEVNPGATDLCQDDRDCDGTAPQPQTWCRDDDNDGYGTSADSHLNCGQPTGFVGDCTDCNDDCVSCFPGGTELCDDGMDNDCDGVIDCKQISLRVIFSPVEAAPPDQPPGGYLYTGEAGEFRTIFAPPSEGYCFSHWSGEGVEGSIDNPIEILLDRDRTITAQCLPRISDGDLCGTGLCANGTCGTLLFTVLGIWLMKDQNRGRRRN